MSFQRYVSYKESGVNWVDQLPTHWSRTRIKHAARSGSKTFIDGDWIEAPYITNEGVRLIQCGNVGTGAFEEQGFRYVSEKTFSELDCTEVEPNDVLICRLQSSRTILAGRACLAPRLGVKMITSVDNCILKPSSEFDPRYIVYQLSTPAYLSFIEVIARGGTRDRISRSMLGDTEILAPPVTEQSAIAEFLDRETAKIGALMEEQQRLIELLKEKRQAVISHAVTKGLNPNAPMKPSGIEWLGDVPEHWQIAPVNFRYSVQLGKMLDSTKITGHHLRSYLRVFDVQWGEINTDDLPVMDFDDEAREKFRLVPGDLLINEGGSYPGRSAIWIGQLEECYYQKALHRLRPRRQDEDASQFFYYLMYWASTHGVFAACGNESTIEHLPAEKLRRYRFAFPTLIEQRRIVEFLDRETAKFDTLTAEAQLAIDLLQERRNALISAAVTGKIDVRGLAESEAA